MIYIVCGVAGSGKTTIGKMLASRLEVPFFDGDDFHPSSNVEKMSAGIALSDEDRKGWLEEISRKIIQWDRKGSAVLACSALKETYRKTLSSIDSHHIQWIILEGGKELITERVRSRKDHFFNKKILDTQFNIFEKPKYGWFFDVKDQSKDIVENIIRRISATTRTS